MLRLRRLKINKFRAVKPGTELTFHDGFNVLLGRNATGKTTLLKLISMALRFDFSSIRDEDFDIKVEADELLADTSNSVIMQVGTRIDDTALAVSMPGQRQRIPWVKATIRVGSETYGYEEEGQTWQLLKNETVIHTGSVVREWGQALIYWACLSIVKIEGLQLPLPIWGSIQRGSGRAIRHDESLDTFKEDILSAEFRVTVCWPDKRPMVVMNAFTLFPALIFVPASLTKQVHSCLTKTPDAASLMFSSGDLPFLDSFIRLCGFESARLELSLLGKEEIEGNLRAAEATFGKPRFLFTRKGGKSTIRHELLSYGQKRLLSLLYYLDASPSHLVADEMVNGLHHEWLEEIMERIGDRQTFLSSQNPLLLDYMEFASVDDVSRSFVLCELDDLDRLVWRNMSAEEAGSFYSAYAVGIQHVGEILRTKGLW